MKPRTTSALVAIAIATFFAADASAAVSRADQCRASKLGEAGKYGACLLKAEGQGVKKGVPANFDKCNAKFTKKWAQLDAKSAGSCPTLNDASAISTVVDNHRVEVGNNLAGSFGDILNNKVALEIEGVIAPAGRNVVMVQGPGFTINRIAGSSGTGGPQYTPGFSTDIPMIFEHVVPDFGADPDGPALAQAFADHQAGTFSFRTASLILRTLAGDEQARWNMFELAPTESSLGTDGRDRYTWASQVSAPSIANTADGGATFDPLQAAMFDTATDKPVEIEGIGGGFYYPQVSDDTAQGLLTFTFFYHETAALFQWAKDTRDGVGSKRALSVLEFDPVTLAETSRTNYFETFPVSYRLVTGFVQPELLQIELVVSYDFSAPG